MSTDSDSTKEMVRGVFDRAASTYDQTGVEFFGVVGRELVERCAPHPGDQVLDLGCGLGAAALPAAERVGATGRVLAIDLSERMVEGLRARAAHLPQLEARVGDAEDPDVEPGRWDVVQASLVLFFLPDVTSAVRRYRRLLRPDGRLAFSWFGADDQRWDPVDAALVADLPAEEHGPRRPQGTGQFASVAAMESFLHQAGYLDVHSQLVDTNVTYADEDAWWATLWSHGRRATMERLRDAGVLDSTRRRIGTALAPLTEPDGTLVWRGSMAYSLARSPNP
jgi:SAM-dependent methyltransferase